MLWPIPNMFFTEAVFTADIVHVRRRVSRAEVPDMPDRMVAATAVYFDVPVISRDRRIRAASIETVGNGLSSSYRGNAINHLYAVT